jgi:long-subunit acyl-CoA synthetase (AMP-forming)
MPLLPDEDLVLHRFYEHARRRPDAIWLTQPLGGGRVEHIPFARALDEAKRMAAYLRSLALPPQSRIAVVSKNCAHYFLSDLAIWMAGHVTVSIYPTQDAPTVRYILEHSGARLLFVGKLDGWGELRRGVPSDLPCVAYPLAPPDAGGSRWDDVVARHAPIPDDPRRGPSDRACIFYTSGTTGRPKGVVHSFATISVPTAGLVRALAIGPSDRYLSYLPLAHVMERWVGECQAMWSGARVFFSESLETFVDDLRRARPTLFASVPRLLLKFQAGVQAKLPQQRLERLLRIPLVSRLVKRKILRGLGLDQVRFAGSGSAAAPPALIAWYRALGLDLVEGYGMTENFCYSHLGLPGRYRAGFAGPAQEGVECRIGEGGEVQVRTPGNMVCYFEEPDLTRAAFTADGFLRTGDQGVIEDGQLRITGRVKELFKTTKGKYVAPAPIEGLIAGEEPVELCCVAGAGHPAAHAIVQLAEGPAAAAVQDAAARAATTRALETLLDHVNAGLPPYERLAFLAVARDRWSVEGGFLTPTLKVKRAAIEKRYGPALDGWYASGRKVIWEE